MVEINKDWHEKEKRRRKYSQAAPEGLQVFAAKHQPSFHEDTSPRRVAIYARVSTGDVRQTSSYEMQQHYYSDMVQRHPNWTLVKIYADEGISGTSTKKRAAFNEMIADCRARLIDIVIVKSVSRFSRNIMDSIGYARELAKLSPAVGVYFENENLYTLSDDREFRLSMFSSFAQEESRTKSVSMNSSIEMRFSRGIFLTPPLLGYDNDEDGRLVVNEDEAGTVQLIFFLYLYGHSTKEIAQLLTTQHRRTKKGNTTWQPGCVYNILRNERYMGAVRARKTWTPDFLDHKSIKNRQDKNQYYKENHHESIVTRDDFIAVQQMLNNAKYGCQRFLPQLHVIKDGALHGFVAVSPSWAAFTAEDYRAASASVGEEDTPPVQALARRGDIDLRGYTVAHASQFSRFGMNYITFASNKLRCNSFCARKLDSNYAQLLVHPTKMLFALRPCEKEHRNALRLGQCGASAFYGTICALLGWEPEQAHVLIGTPKEQYTLFDANAAQYEGYYSHMAKQRQRPGAGEITHYNTYAHLNPTVPAQVKTQLESMGGLHGTVA